ncbi:MAG TPA: tripartite tricarboxylate transporter substrate binding protein, partial [Cupriavidus sp.]|nr:tripartite tricarboxylate transporter substrate binding protein [Cupriavidus sp.]
DLVAAARAKPGTLNFGTSSTGYRTIITAFNDAAKIQTMSVPYKAMSNLLPDLISGVV